MRCAAFLRAVNAGKFNSFRMEDLRALLRAEGFEDVRTYLQTGNVWFQSGEADPEAIARRIEALMPALGCRDVAVMVRTEEHLRELVGLDPFGADGGTHCRFITFLREPAPAALPAHRELEVVLARPGEVFSRLDKNVRNVSPNAFIESRLKVRATTRFWNVVQEMYGLS
ncbi:MAG: hypothetical protein C4342_02135 [Armatimonadota bacterium]